MKQSIWSMYIRVFNDKVFDGKQDTCTVSVYRRGDHTPGEFPDKTYQFKSIPDHLTHAIHELSNRDGFTTSVIAHQHSTSIWVTPIR